MVRSQRQPRVKPNIILFIVGALIFVGALYFATEQELTFAPWLRFLSFIGIAGIIIQVIAIYRLRPFSRFYVASFVAVIFDFLFVVGYLVFATLYFIDRDWFPELGAIVAILNILMTLAETIIMVCFVVGTNKVAEEYGRGMPKLTKIILLVYLILVIFDVILPIITLTGATLPDNFFFNLLVSSVGILSLVRHVLIVVFLVKAIIVIPY